MASRPRHSRIHDVAKEAGVSITTVSHVFSGNRPVAESTKQAVYEAVSRLKYMPFGTAHGLATGRSMVVGIQFPFEPDDFSRTPFFLTLLAALSTEAAARGYSFMLMPSQQTDTFPLHSLIASGRIDAAIIVNPTTSNELVGQLTRNSIPTITIGRPNGNISTHTVDNNYKEAMHDVVSHLASVGCRRIALLSELDEISFVEDIEEGFGQAVSLLGLDEGVVRRIQLNDRAAEEAAIELLDRSAPADGIIASSDVQAIGVLRAAATLSIPVPERLAVVGLGETVVSLSSHPALTTLDTKPTEIAITVFSLLVELTGMKKPKRGRQHRIVDAELHVRASSERKNLAQATTI